MNDKLTDIEIGKQKFIGGINFDELKSQRIQVYNVITLDLTSAKKNEEHVFTGTYVYVVEASDITANVDVKFNEIFRNDINLVKGRGVRCPFYRFFITNTAQAAKWVTIAIGIESADFEIFDVGKALEISGSIYTNTWFEDARLKRAFAGYSACSPGAGTNAALQLWNPTGSGVICYVTKITGHIATAGKYYISRHNVAYTSVAAPGGANKYLYESAPQAEIRREDDGLGTHMLQKISNTDLQIEHEFFPAIVVPETTGLCVQAFTATVMLTINFEWIEV